MKTFWDYIKGKTLTRTWIVLIVAVSLLPPVTVLVAGWHTAERTLATDLRALHILAARHIARTPDSWWLSTERLEYVLGDLHQPDQQIVVRRRDTNEVLLTIGAPPSAPRMTHTREIGAAGGIAADLQLTQSLQPLVALGLKALFGSLLLAIAAAIPAYRIINKRMDELASRLAINEQRYRKLFTDSDEGLVVVDAQFCRFSEFNAAAHTLLGYTPEEFFRLTLDDLFMEPASYGQSDQGAITATQEQRPPDPVQIMLRHKDGSPVHAEHTFYAAEVGDTAAFMLRYRDISWRKRTEAELAESRQFLQTVLDTLPIRVFWKDLKGHYLGCNKAFARDAGVAEASALIGLDDTRLVWAANADAYMKDDREVMATGQAKLAYIEPQRQSDGSQVWLRTWKVPLRDIRNQIVGMLGVYDDITAQKEAEDRLRQRESLLEAIFAQVSDAIEVTDVETTRFVEFNDAAPRLHGYTREEFAQLHIADIDTEISASDLERLKEEMQAGRRVSVTSRHRRKDGTLFDVQISASLIHHMGRQYAVAVRTDITQRLAAQRALERQVAFTEGIIAAEVDGLAVCHGIDTFPYVRFSVWNEAMMVLTGFSHDEINSLGWYQTVYIGPEVQERARARMERMRLGDHLHGEEWTITRKDGESRIVEIHTRTVAEDENGPHVLAVMRDVTERKQHELAITRLNEELERRVADRTAKLVAKEYELQALNKNLAVQVEEKLTELREKEALLIDQSRHAAMGEMIGNIAHQWRQPLSMLSLVIQNLRYDYVEGRLDAALLESHVGRALHAIEQMTSTIDDFRDFFKPSRQREYFNLAAAIANCHDLVGASLQSHDIEWRISAAPDIAVFGYPSEFSQIILNLIGNAKEAILARGVAGGWVAITATRQGENALVVVEDNGGGIDLEHLDKIFDPYFTTKSKGTGIGLYMSRTILEQHMHGTIAARNGNEGARFELAFPLAPPES